jgi:hypothetical protein
MPPATPGASPLRKDHNSQHCPVINSAPERRHNRPGQRLVDRGSRKLRGTRRIANSELGLGGTRSPGGGKDGCSGDLPEVGLAPLAAVRSGIVGTSLSCLRAEAPVAEIPAAEIPAAEVSPACFADLFNDGNGNATETGAYLARCCSMAAWVRPPTGGCAASKR